MMWGGAGLDAHQAGLKRHEKSQHVSALQLSAHNNLAVRIHPMNLKNRLGDVQTNRRDRLHLGSSESWSLQTATTPLALACRWRSRSRHASELVFACAG